jgi:hypothetical protein
MLTEQGRTLEAAQFCESKDRKELAADLYSKVGASDSSDHVREEERERKRQNEKLATQKKEKRERANEEDRETG